MRFPQNACVLTARLGASPFPRMVSMTYGAADTGPTNFHLELISGGCVRIAPTAEEERP